MIKLVHAIALAFAACLLLPSPSLASTSVSTSVVVSPNGMHVYAGFNGVGFTVFDRDANTGQLTVAGEAPGSLTGGPLFAPALAVSADGANVYGVDAQDNELLQYAPFSGGANQQASYPVLANTAVAKEPITLAVSRDGLNVYVVTAGVQYGTGIGVSSDGKVNVFTRDPTSGNLTFMSTTQLGSASNAGETGTVPILSADGRFLYVADTFGVGVLSRNPSTGALTYLGDDGGLSSGGVNGAIALALSPDNNYVYEAGPPSSSTSNSSAIAVLSRNSSTGRLTPVSSEEVQNGAGGVSGLSDIWGLTVSPDGQCLYATSRADNSLGYFTRNPSTGALTFGGVVTEGTNGITGLAQAREVTVSPDGNDIYVASPGDNGIAVFTRNPTTCAPTFVQLAQDLFTLGSPSLNPVRGTATLPVNVATSGTLETTVAALAGHASARRSSADPSPIQVNGPQTVQVPITLDPQDAKSLAAHHALTVKATVTFTATGGSPTTKTTVIHLVEHPASLSRLGVSPSQFALAGRKVKGRCVAARGKQRTAKSCRRPIKLIVSYTLNASSPVTFTVAVPETGHRVKGRCVKPTGKNRRHGRCTRLVRLRGKLTRTGGAGANHFAWSAVLGGHRLAPGSYELLATPTGGTPKATRFKILAG